MTTAPDLDAVFERAAAAFQAGDLEAAAEGGALLLDHAPSHPAALNLMGLVRLRQNRGDEAAALFRRAAEAAPNDPGVQRNLGHALKQAGRAAEALAAYESAAALAPGDAGAHYDLATALMRAGMPNRAEDSFRRVLRAKAGHGPSSLALAQLLEQRGAAADAVDVLDAAAAAAPGDLDLCLAVAHTLHRAGRLGEATQRYRDAVAKHPDSADATAALGFTLGEAGALDEAVDTYRRALDIDPGNAGVWSNLGWTLVELNRHADALSPCQRAVELAPDLPAAHYHLALAARGVGRLDEAAGSLEAALRIDRRHVRALSLLGTVREELGQTDAARRIFDPERLIERRVPAAPDGFDTVDTFNRALAEAVSGHPSLMWNRPARSTVSGSQTLDISRDPSPAVRGFRALIEDAVRGYLDTRAGEAAPGDFFHDPPSRWDLVIWGVQLRASGHQIAHNHPSGIVSGVYYPALPSTIGVAGQSEAGHIEFRSASGRDDDAEMEGKRHRAAYRPEEGHMLLFPSYFWHRTVPFEGTQHRISVAFDAIPRD